MLHGYIVFDISKGKGIWQLIFSHQVRLRV
jgi:hypothetical protein